MLTLGEANSAAPLLAVEIYRAGREMSGFTAPQDDLAKHAAEAGPISELRMEAPLPSKFGLLSIAAFDVTKLPVRHCLGFLHDFDDPPLQLSRRFCQGGADFIERSTG
jgi:hypothetical protein